MPRKNYKTRETRRKHVVEYTPAEFSADYDVIMTNGSGLKTITVTGSSVSAWHYATRLGLNEDDEYMPGVWHPVSIKSVDGTWQYPAEMFTVVGNG